MDTSFAFAPNTEAVALISGLRPVASSVFYGLLPELRARAFTVSGVEGANVLQRVRDAIAALPQGIGPDGKDYTWDTQAKEIAAELEPFLGEEGAARRAEILLRTSGFQAFSTTIWNIAQADDDTTHLQYIHGDQAKDPTPSHLALDGIVLPKDDPFWETHTGPWGHLGCVCYVRPMNEDLVAEEQAKDDTKANPEDRNVVDGPALEQLRNGTFIRGGQRHDVSAPEGERAFKWHPDDLRIPLDDLKLRYDPPVWDAFHLWAMKTMVEPGTTVWQWLEGKEPKPTSAERQRIDRTTKNILDRKIPTGPTIPQAAPPQKPVVPKLSAPVIPPLNSTQTSLKAAGFSDEVVNYVGGLPSEISRHMANLKFARSPKSKVCYNPNNNTVQCYHDPKNYYGHPLTVLHEAGHNVHFNLGVVNNTHVSQDLLNAMRADFDAWKKTMETKHGADWKTLYGVRNPMDQIAKDFKYATGRLDPAAPAADGIRVLGFADTLMAVSHSAYGIGHSKPYMGRSNHRAMEAFAHAFRAIADNDSAFLDTFKNLVAEVRKQLSLP